MRDLLAVVTIALAIVFLFMKVFLFTGPADLGTPQQPQGTSTSIGDQHGVE